MKLTVEQAIERAFNNCNLIGEDVDIYKQIYKYKILSNLTLKEIEKIYDEIAERLGFTN